MFAHTAAVFFSVDCVVVRGDNLSRLVEERLGLSGPMSVHEAGADAAPARWAGVTERALHTQLAELPVLPGVEETTLWCWNNGLVPVISSLTWAPIGAYLANRFGFHSYFGRPLDAVHGRFTGTAGDAPAPTGEREFALRRADELGAAPQKCAAVGACPADDPLFDSVGVSIAFNARSGTNARMVTPVQGDDLRAVIPTLESLSATMV
ncbi:haloacid dehalogenase [Streptomyces sp. NPDC006552]|uniref:haloacid dehalogenase n=1 Tax=Streptomyces sp. NPDC006552 TaxID=3157179 RepID=UPI0033A81089